MKKKKYLYKMRPCGSKTRAKDRYTRAELVDLAKKNGIPNISSKSMDELCELLKLTSQHKKQIITTNTDGCFIDPNRACNKSSKNPNKYRLPELKTIWKKECKKLPEFKSEKPTTIDAYCSLMKNRYARIHFTALDGIPEKFRIVLTNWFSKLKRSTLKKKKVPISIKFKYLSLNICSQDSKNILMKLEEIADYKIVEQSLKVICPLFEPFDSHKAFTTPSYLYNKNVHQFPSEFLKRQNEYIMSLDSFDRYRVLGYTYAGDKMVNQFLLGNMEIDKIIDQRFVFLFKNNYLFPLAVDFFLMFLKFKNTTPNFNSWNSSIFNGGLGFTTDEISYLQNFYDNNLTDAFPYIPIIDLLAQYGKRMKLSIWEYVIKQYINELSRIINEAPEAPPEGFRVYRGVKETGFLNIEARRNIFVNKTFMSTSLDLCTALKSSFVSTWTGCCLFAIQVLPKTKCLFIGPISYFKEQEILFAPDKHLFMIESKKKSVNSEFDVISFSIVN